MGWSSDGAALASAEGADLLLGFRTMTRLIDWPQRRRRGRDWPLPSGHLLSGDAESSRPARPVERLAVATGLADTTCGSIRLKLLNFGALGHQCPAFQDRHDIKHPPSSTTGRSLMTPPALRPDTTRTAHSRHRTAANVAWNDRPLSRPRGGRTASANLSNTSTLNAVRYPGLPVTAP